MRILIERTIYAAAAGSHPRRTHSLESDRSVTNTCGSLMILPRALCVYTAVCANGLFDLDPRPVQYVKRTRAPRRVNYITYVPGTSNFPKNLSTRVAVGARMNNSRKIPSAGAARFDGV